MESDMVVFIGRQFVVHPHCFFGMLAVCFTPPQILLSQTRGHVSTEMEMGVTLGRVRLIDRV